MLTNEVRISFGLHPLTFLRTRLPSALKPSETTPRQRPSTGSVMSAIPAIRPMIEVDAVFAVASTLSVSHVPKRNAWLPQRLPSKTAAVRRPPLTCTYSVELRGFEPLTPSMRTRCATGLRYSPWNESQRSKLCLLLAPPMSWPWSAAAPTPRLPAFGRVWMRGMAGRGILDI
jgi:hypothetical protein